MSHWYTRDGKPAHTQPTKKGAKNKERPTTAKEAQTLGLFPSVSDILKMAANPGLDRWKMCQVVKACYDCPAGLDSYEEYEAVMLEKAGLEAADAAELGTRIHAAIESYFTHPDDPLDDEMKDYVFPVIDTIERLSITPVSHEVVTVVPNLGYAGTTDMAFISGPFNGILDFKSTKTKPDEPVVPRQGHIAQIAAYHRSYWSHGKPIEDNAIGYNIYISTTEPGRVQVSKYDAATLRRELEWFDLCLGLWRHKYWDSRAHGTAEGESLEALSDLAN